jgi:hypothetical protein
MKGAFGADIVGEAEGILCNSARMKRSPKSVLFNCMFVCFFRCLSSSLGSHLRTSRRSFGQRIVEELERRRWGPEKLPHLPKAHHEKLKIAGRLRAETTVTLKWISDNLHMGAPAYLGNCLRTIKR